MAGSSAGIKVGTQISLLIRNSSEQPIIYYRDLQEARAEERRKALLASLDNGDFNSLYAELKPIAEIGLPFKPKIVKADYLSWPLLPELLPSSFPGVKTSRDDALVDIDRTALEQRMRRYFDPNVSDEEIRRVAPSLMKITARFDPKQTRAILQKRGFRSENIIRYAYRPFDIRWLYWEPETKLLDEKRSEYFPQCFTGNITLVSQQKPRRDWSEPQVIRPIGCLDLMDRGASCFPLYIKPFHHRNEYQLNLSNAATDYLARLDTDAPALFHHIVAILHAPAYRADNAGALKQDWPRIPLPATQDQLLASAELGRQIAALLDTETPLPGVTQGKPRPELANIALLTVVGSAPAHAGTPETDRRLGPCRQGRRHHARQGSHGKPPVHGAGTTRAGRRNAGCVSQRRLPLEKPAAPGVGIHPRRLSSPEKMAVISGIRIAEPAALRRRSLGIYLGGPSHRGAGFVATSAG
ncbi:MAG: type ISP restriction/modification enzyme [Candidatus Competibacter sp.]